MAIYSDNFDAFAIKLRSNDIEIWRHHWITFDVLSFIITAADSKSLRILLSFAVGGLLGDVFLHLLPQAWSSEVSQSTNGNCMHMHMNSIHHIVNNKTKLTICVHSRWPSIDAKRPMGAGRRAYIHNHRKSLFRLCKCRRKQSTAEMCWNCQLFVTEKWWKAARKQGWISVRPKRLMWYRGCSKRLLFGWKINAREENTSTE